MMAINPQMAGGAPTQGAGMQPQAGGQQAQIVQQLRQMDHEQLVMVTLQLITRLQELQARMGAGAPQGGTPQQPMR